MKDKSTYNDYQVMFEMLMAKWNNMALVYEVIYNTKKIFGSSGVPIEADGKYVQSLLIAKEPDLLIIGIAFQNRHMIRDNLGDKKWHYTFPENYYMKR